jgi:hypothetical protein
MPWLMSAQDLPPLIWRGLVMVSKIIAKLGFFYLHNKSRRLSSFICATFIFCDNALLIISGKL